MVKFKPVKPCAIKADPVHTLKDLKKDLVWKWARFKDLVRYDIPQGISNIVYWLPVIWRLRDWDHAYLWQVMEHQMSAMKSAMSKDKYFSNYKSLDRGHKLIRELLNRDNCNCHRLGNGCELADALSCAKLQDAILKEFCHILEKDCRRWWT